MRPPVPSLRQALRAPLALLPLALLALAQPAATAEIAVNKTATCGCCTAWIDHLRESGHTVTAQNHTYGALAQIKQRLGLQPQHASCHTAVVEGYVIEGHVPEADIARLLAERPDALGLAVPGMPVGSPGMEMGGQVDPHDVLLLRRDGSEEVFTAYR
jgi:hypothetical protein